MLIAFLLGTVMMGIAFVYALVTKMYRTNVANFIVVAMLFVGYGAVSWAYVVLDSERYALLFGCVAMGLAICMVSVKMMRDTAMCTIPRKGIYHGFVAYPGSKGQKCYAPVFEYEYMGKRYREQCAQSYPEKLLIYDMTPGERYTVYIDGAKPENVVMEKTMTARTVMVFFVGVAFVVMGIAQLML